MACSSMNYKPNKTIRMETVINQLLVLKWILSFQVRRQRLKTIVPYVTANILFYSCIKCRYAVEAYLRNVFEKLKWLDDEEYSSFVPHVFLLCRICLCIFGQAKCLFDIRLLMRIMNSEIIIITMFGLTCQQIIILLVL